MNRNLVLLVLFAIIVIPAFLLIQNQLLSKTQQSLRSGPNILIDGHIFSLLLAKSEAEKEKGLSDRASVDMNTGMLFIFDKEGNYDFWMKRMRFPLDIIWMNKNKIVTIAEDLQPATSSDDTEIPRFKSVVPADTVLEINSGLSKKYNFKVGDSVKINL